MRRFHLLGQIALLIDCVLKDLLISKHPVPIEKEDHWGVMQPFHHVFGHFLIHPWRHLVSVCDLISLSHPEDDVG